eukprot:GILI01006187.1.p1 GENE.GILI01006187.1~~GILI01006187.1.p1  ORF type:complete len:405 (+),score=76.77 GILI01006187.1:83-1297(+)
MSAEPLRVYLNVYNLLNANKESASGLSAEALNIVGMGIHHSGVEVFGDEWSFGGDSTGRNDPQTDGVFSVVPRTACGFFKEQIDLGLAPPNFNEERFYAILDQLRPKWRACSYHILEHNCNFFAATLVKAIDEGFPPGTPDTEKLSSKVPSWVNRAASTGSVLVPNALIAKITETLSPPGACAPDLVNFIDVPAHTGVFPSKLAPQALPGSETPAQEEEHPSAGGLAGGLKAFGGFAKKAAGTVASTIKTAVSNHIDDRDRKDYAATFAGVRAEDLISAYTCTVLHINRTQKAKIFIATDGLRFSGPNGLNTYLSYNKIDDYHYSSVVTALQGEGNALPTFSPISSTEEVSGLVLFLKVDGREGRRMVPVYNLSFVGAPVNKSQTVTRNAVAYVDNAYRRARGM